MEAGRESRVRGEVAAYSDARTRPSRAKWRIRAEQAEPGASPAAGLEELTAAAQPGVLFAKHDHIRCVVNARDSESLAIQRPLKLGIFLEVKSVT